MGGKRGTRQQRRAHTRRPYAHVPAVCACASVLGALALTQDARHACRMRATDGKTHRKQRRGATCARKGGSSRWTYI
jgi:hypothetical protein